jgi:hypothetical protein
MVHQYYYRIRASFSLEAANLVVSNPKNIGFRRNNTPFYRPGLFCQPKKSSNLPEVIIIYPIFGLSVNI